MNDIVSREEAVDICTAATGLYDKDELELLYDATVALPIGGRVLEIGVLYGKSSLIFMQLAAHMKLDIVWIDPFMSMGEEIKASFYDKRTKYGNIGTVVEEDSSKAGDKVQGMFDLIHVDGNHFGPGPRLDCEIWLPRLNSGGFACFHDYRGPIDSFPDVDAAVDNYTAGWETVARANRLIIKRKP